MVLEVKLDVPPSLNNIYATAFIPDPDAADNDPKPHSRRVMTAEGHAYKEKATWEIKSAAQHIAWAYKGGSIYLELKLHFRDRRRRDISNCVKIVEDAAAEALGFDDKRVCILVVCRGLPDPSPHCLLTLIEVEPGQVVKLAMTVAE